MPSFGDREYKELRERVIQDATQIGIALSRVTEGRKIRQLGVLSGMTANKREKYVLNALATTSNCEILLETVFPRIFANGIRFINRKHRLGNIAKRDIVYKKFQIFMELCQVVLSLQEIAYGIIDTFYKYFEIMTTMGLRPPERQEGEEAEGPGWIAADQDRLETARRAKHAAEDRAIRAGIISTRKKEKRTVKDIVLSVIEGIKVEELIIPQEQSVSVSPLSESNAQTRVPITDSASENNHAEDDLKLKFFEPEEDKDKETAEEE